MKAVNAFTLTHYFLQRVSIACYVRGLY